MEKKKEVRNKGNQKKQDIKISKKSEKVRNLNKQEVRKSRKAENEILKKKKN